MTEPGAAAANVERAYRSALFDSFVDGVARLEEGIPVLDLGPANSENLMFWIRRDRPVAASDLRVRVTEGRRLELDGRRFGGIICWNALAFIPSKAAAEVVAQLIEVLVPGGLMFAIFDGDGRRAPQALRYRILGDGRLGYAPSVVEDPPRAIPTSEIERLLGAFRPTRTTVLRHGSREAMGQIPRPPSDPFPGARTLTHDAAGD